VTRLGTSPTSHLTAFGAVSAHRVNKNAACPDFSEQTATV
jgi:hypothetical protein